MFSNKFIFHPDLVISNFINFKLYVSTCMMQVQCRLREYPFQNSDQTVVLVFQTQDLKLKANQTQI